MDFAQLVKVYANPKDDQRYSPDRLGESHGMRPTLLVITVGLSALKSTTELEKARDRV